MIREKTDEENVRLIQEVVNVPEWKARKILAVEKGESEGDIVGGDALRPQRPSVLPKPRAGKTRAVQVRSKAVRSG
jgi:hypothetical protein